MYIKSSPTPNWCGYFLRRLRLSCLYDFIVHVFENEKVHASESPHGEDKREGSVHSPLDQSCVENGRPHHGAHVPEYNEDGGLKHRDDGETRQTIKFFLTSNSRQSAS